MSFARLDAHLKKLETLSHAQSMLGVDEAVMMPEGGGEKRGEALSGLAAMYHEMASAPHVADWISDAEVEDLSPEDRTALTEYKRSYTNLTCLPTEFVARQTTARIRCEQAWRKLKPANDWANFAPLLEANVELAREEAHLRASVLGCSAYDALIEQFDPGSSAAAIEPVFSELKDFLVDFIPQALEAQAQRKPKRAFNGTFPISQQKALGEDLMKAIGFDFNHGRLDVSHHPFCGGVPSDVRMTTRYRDEDFLSALMGILHETGHGLYEQGLPKTKAHWPSNLARGMGMHESQSLFVEMQMSRNPAFWQFALPIAKRHFGSLLDGWTVEDIIAHVHHIERGFIRVEADEATYPLHVILRFELEQQLIGGTLEVRDLPEAWDAKMKSYLGLSTLHSPKDGPMQDVHWPSGAFGYFPSYTLGALMAAQQWATIAKANSNITTEISKGNFTTVNDWRRKNIWEKASTLSTPAIMEAATGEPLNAKYFIAHVKQRYLT
jgi:carboxypeptidase Taq